MATSICRVLLAKRTTWRVLMRSFSAASVGSPSLDDETDAKFLYPTTDHERQQRLADIQTELQSCDISNVVPPFRLLIDYARLTLG
jgi:hypothetical protein